jgi:hypothetical protein
MRVDKDRCLIKNSRIMCKEIDGATVLIDPYRRTFVRLNSTASGIWRLIDSKHTCSAIIQELKSIFEVEDIVLEKDVVGFLKQLLEREIIK